MNFSRQPFCRLLLARWSSWQRSDDGRGAGVSCAVSYCSIISISRRACLVSFCWRCWCASGHGGHAASTIGGKKTKENKTRTVSRLADSGAKWFIHSFYPTLRHQSVIRLRSSTTIVPWAQGTFFSLPSRPPFDQKVSQFQFHLHFILPFLRLFLDFHRLLHFFVVEI